MHPKKTKIPDLHPKQKNPGFAAKTIKARLKNPAFIVLILSEKERGCKIYGQNFMDNANPTLASSLPLYLNLSIFGDILMDILFFL